MARRLRRGRYLAAAAVGIGLLAAGCANEKAAGRWSGKGTVVNGWRVQSLDDIRGFCSAKQEMSEHPFKVILLTLGERDGGYLALHLTDPTLAQTTAKDVPVLLKFDSATIEGFDMTYDAKERNYHVSVLLFGDLSETVSIMEKASRLTLTAGATSTSFDLPGFGAAITALRQCAKV